LEVVVDVDGVAVLDSILIDFWLDNFLGRRPPTRKCEPFEMHGTKGSLLHRQIDGNEHARFYLSTSPTSLLLDKKSDDAMTAIFERWHFQVKITSTLD
jgi:hypothetical protein